jgi:ubiquinone/menaquinone biosynthesis C-methylase UbiE
LFCNNYIKYNSQNNKALEIGSRRGGLSLFLALNKYTVICSDVSSPETLQSSSNDKHIKYNVTSQITYDSVNVLDIKYPDNYFDIVVFKSVLGALRTKDNQQLALNEIHRILKPNGILLFAENAVGNLLITVLRNRFVYWSSYWRYVTINEIIQMCSLFSSVEIESYGLLGALGWNEKIRGILGIFDLLVINIIPKNWRYIIFACARK